MKGRRAALIILLALLGPSAAWAAPGWQHAETEHFLFVFRPSERAAADELLTFCEEVYAQVTGFFRSYPSKIPCIIRGGLDSANGSMAPFPARIDLIVTAPSDHWMGARSESWLRILLTHELTHFVHLTLDRGFFAALSRVFGRDVAMGSAIFLPWWMVEGPTTNLETIFTAGGRGRNPLFEIFSKAPLVEGDLFGLRQAGYASSFPPSGRIYVAGYILVDYILDTFGPDAFTRIMDAYLAFPFFGPWAAIEKVTGIKAPAVYAAMKGRLADTYRSASGIPGGARITPEAIGNYHRPQPTGRGLYLYRSSPDMAAAIVRYDPATKKEEILVRAALTDKSSFCATADGETVYFASLAWDWRQPGMDEAVSDLYRLDRRTGRIDRLTRGAHLWQPTVSADGRRIAAVQGTGSYSRLVSVDPGSGAVRELYAQPGSNVFTPSFSPDGERLVFTVNVRGFQDICLLALRDGDPGEARLLTGPDPDGEYYPGFLPDGRIIFSSDRTGSLCLYSLDPDSGDLARLLEDPVAAISAVADGESLVYSSYASTGFCLKQVPIAGLQPISVTTAAPAQVPPAPVWTGRTVQSRPYADVPIPYAWHPWFPVDFGASGSIDVGLGARALGASLLGLTSWSLGMAWHPATAQPRLALDASTALGSLRIDGSILADYSSGSGYRQDLAATLAFWYPLAWQHSLGTGFVLVARTRLTFDTSLASPVGFDFTDTLSSPAADWTPSAWITPGIALRWQQTGAPREFYPPWDLSAALDGSWLLPVFPASGPSRRLALFLSGSVPSVIAHHVLRLGAKASWTPGAAGAFLDSFVAPRGAFSLPPRNGPGLVLGSVDYLVPVALLDVPLALGLGLTGIGVGAHAEWGGQFGASPAFFLADSAVFVGLEVTLQLTAAVMEFPVGIGLSTRLHTAGGRFDPGEDLRPYIFLSFDSLRDAARPGAARPGRPPIRAALP